MFWKMTNCVLSSKFLKFNLNYLQFETLSSALDVLKVENSFSYNRFYGIVILLPLSNTTAVLFPNGHCNMTGCINEDFGISAFLELVDVLNACFILTDNEQFKIEFDGASISNICGTLKLGFQIDITSLYNSGILDGLQESLDENNQNRILYYSGKHCSTCFILFRSGTINVVGGKNRGEINRTFKMLINVLKLFKK